MTNPSKQKGTAWETAVVSYLRDHGFPQVERRTLHGNQDQGDIAGIPDWVLELKATKTIDLAGAIDEAILESVNADADFYAAIIKRRQKSAGEAYVVMDLAQFTRILYVWTNP